MRFEFNFYFTFNSNMAHNQQVDKIFNDKTFV